MVNSELENQRNSSFTFGPFMLIPDRQSLQEGETPIRIGSRALDILTVLVESPGVLIGKRELIARVWSDTVVDDNNLKVNMAALRRALGDEPGSARYIATVPGRGYRFVASVQVGGMNEFIRIHQAEAAPTHNLPFARTRVFGRADVVASIRHDLQGSRLVTIVGPGGIGKTTVALAVAEQALGSFKHGVWLVDLAVLKDPLMVPNAIAIAIGIRDNSGNMLAALCESLRTREMLLVLDNCEHIVEAAAKSVGALLTETRHVSIIATSREPLRISGERLKRLSGLGAPPPSTPLNAESALAFPAIQLFVDRATDRLESFKLDDAEAPVVAEICRKLDGVALAIEFAATRVDAFDVRGLLQQLDDRSRMLVGRRAGPERQRTLSATLDWSYSLLPKAESELICALSVFAGSFEMEGAASVTNMPSSDVSLAVSELVAKSLISVDVRGQGVTYRLLESTRIYCMTRLQASGEEHHVRERHAEHVCALLQRAKAEWSQHAATHWEATFGHALGDLRSALDWAGREESNRSLRIRLSVLGVLLWNHFSLTEECRLHVSQAIDEIDSSGLSGTAYEMELKIWLGSSTMFTQGLRHQTLETMRRALEISIQIGDTECHLRCLCMIGVYQVMIGEHRAALETLTNFSYFATAHDLSALPEVETNLGAVELFLGHLENARRRLQFRRNMDLIDLAKDTQVLRFSSSRIMDVACTLSHVQWIAGFPDSAVKMAEAAIEHAKEINHHLSISKSFAWASIVFYWVGRFDLSRNCLDMLDEQVKRHGHFIRRPLVNFFRAAIDLGEGNGSIQTVNLLHVAIEDFRSSNYLVRMPYHLGILADAQSKYGSLSDAEVTIVKARDLAYHTNEQWCIPEVLRIHASILAMQNRSDEAEALLIEAISISKQISALSWKLRATKDLAKLWSVGQQAGAGRILLSQTLHEFNEGFSSRDLMEAEHLSHSFHTPDR